MKDMVPKATGNSRLLRSSIPADTTHDELVSMLRAGTFPFDFAGLNAAGISQQGTPLNKSTLLSDETVQKLGIPGSAADATVNDAFMQLSGGMTRLGDVVISMQKEPLPGWYRCDGSLCEDEALAALLRTSLKHLIAKSSNVCGNTVIFGTVMQANGKYFVMCGEAGAADLYYADELVGPWKKLNGTSNTVNFIEYANGLYYYYYYASGNYQFYVYTQPNLDNTTGRQQVYSLTLRQYCRYNPVIRFKGKTYMMFGAYENASWPALFEARLTPTVGLTLVKVIGDKDHTSSPWSSVFDWCIATDEAIVCWYYNQTGSALCYSTNTTEWHWVKNMVFNGFASYTVQQYGLRYSKILNKWLIMGYKTNSIINIVNSPLYFRIYMNENIEQLHTAYVDAIFDDVVLANINKPIFVETADECYFIFIAQIATENYSPYRQCRLVYDATSQTWQLDIGNYSSSSSSSSVSEYSPEVVSFIDDYIIIPDYLTSNTNCLALYDARKHLPVIENGFIKGGT